MSNRRGGLNPNGAFAANGRRDTPERIDQDLFGQLDYLGRPKRLALDLIRRDGGTQPRAALDQTVIAEYAEALAKDPPDVFPPVDVFYDGKHYWLADGFHRALAHRAAGRPEIPVTIHQGSQRDAVLFSVGVNAAHGLRRSNEDKRRAVLTLLEDPEWGQWSDHRIAELSNTSHTFVSKMRASLTGNRFQLGETREKNALIKVQRGDETYTMKPRTSEPVWARPSTAPRYVGGDEFDQRPTEEIAPRRPVRAVNYEQVQPVERDLQALLHAVIQAVSALVTYDPEDADALTLLPWDRKRALRDMVEQILHAVQDEAEYLERLLE